MRNWRKRADRFKLIGVGLNKQGNIVKMLVLGSYTCQPNLKSLYWGLNWCQSHTEENLSGFSHTSSPDGSSPHYYIKAVFLDSFREWGRQAEPTFQRWGREWGDSNSLGPVLTQTSSQIFLMTFPNTLPQCDNQKCLQTWSNVSSRSNSLWVEDHCYSLFWSLLSRSTYLKISSWLHQRQSY